MRAVLLPSSMTTINQLERFSTTAPTNCCRLGYHLAWRRTGDGRCSSPEGWAGVVLSCRIPVILWVL